MTVLDPWNDAALIAARLSAPSARLVIFIGAESWCERCRSLKPAFESMALQQEALGETWIWLDLEEHAEFLDGFIPDDLPILMSYQGQHLVGVLVGQALTASTFAREGANLPIPGAGTLPDIRSVLLATDWAQ